METELNSHLIKTPFLNTPGERTQWLQNEGANLDLHRPLMYRKLRRALIKGSLSPESMLYNQYVCIPN